MYKMRNWRLPAAVLLAGALSACAVPKEAGFGDVEKLAEIPHRLHWDRDTEKDAEVDRAVDELLSRPLTADGAVQIALLKNPELQARYEDLGIAQAELVEAGLLQNPVFGASVRFLHPGSGTNTEFSLSQEFIDLLMIPAKRKFAGREFERVKLRVASDVQAFVSETAAAYYEAVASAQRAREIEAAADAAQAAALFAGRQLDAGTLRELDYLRHRTFGIEEELALESAREEAGASYDRLVRILGASAGPGSVILPERLPDGPLEGWPLAGLEERAFGQRLDLQAARKETEAFEAVLSMTRTWRWIGGVEAGISHEKDTDGSMVMGPEFQVEIPLFDQKQTGIAKLEAGLRRSRREEEALKARVRGELRDAWRRMERARLAAAAYRERILPARAKMLEEAQLYYNAMLLGVYELLEIRRDEIEAATGYIEALRDYWSFRAELERAAGGKLPGPAAAAPAPQPSTPDPSARQH